MEYCYFCYCSQPSEHGRVATTKFEQQARNTALSMMGAIIQKAANLMILAREKAEEVSSAEILNKSCIVNTLLPLVLAHISPLATIDSRVSTLFSLFFFLSKIYLEFEHIISIIFKLKCAVSSINLCVDIGTYCRYKIG